MKAKYIIFEWNGLNVPVIFSPLIGHDEIQIPATYKPVSAGFVQISFDFKEYNCFGKSETLKLNSRKEDSEIVTNNLQIDI